MLRCKKVFSVAARVTIISVTLRRAVGCLVPDRRPLRCCKIDLPWSVVMFWVSTGVTNTNKECVNSGCRPHMPRLRWRRLFPRRRSLVVFTAKVLKRIFRDKLASIAKMSCMTPSGSHKTSPGCKRQCRTLDEPTFSPAGPALVALSCRVESKGPP